MTKYARDEFDRVPETSTRQGVHRAAAESRRRRLGPILAVGAVALVIGLVAYLILPKLGFNSAGNTAAVTAEQPAGSATASPEPTASTPAPSEAPSAAGTPSGSAIARGRAANPPAWTRPGRWRSTTPRHARAGEPRRCKGRVRRLDPGPAGQLGRSPAADSVDFLRGCGAESQRRGPGHAPGHPDLVDRPSSRCRSSSSWRRASGSPFLGYA